jgi:hypothetical protein
MPAGIYKPERKVTPSSHIDPVVTGTASFSHEQLKPLPFLSAQGFRITFEIAVEARIGSEKDCFKNLNRFRHIIKGQRVFLSREGFFEIGYVLRDAPEGFNHPVGRIVLPTCINLLF